MTNDEHLTFYPVINNCIFEERQYAGGRVQRSRLCNFAPVILQQTTYTDGFETRTVLRLCGMHSDGRELPEIDIDAEELASFAWVIKHWGADCVLEPGYSVKEKLRYAIQTTAVGSERRYIYGHTGWKRTGRGLEYLMPGGGVSTVKLPAKMSGYCMEAELQPGDISCAWQLMESTVAPRGILRCLTAFAFLSPLNYFLRKALCEPKSVLFLTGRTGCGKSSLAALFLSYFGNFTGSTLPMSFQDTANSILHNSFLLKDVLTCVDDYHPASRRTENAMKDTAQRVLRAYGDRTGRGRLAADATAIESRPPRGNAIVTAEFAPDVGESGTARYLDLRMDSRDIDFEALGRFQMAAADGCLRRCMYAYIRWIKARCASEGGEERFVKSLGQSFGKLRSGFRGAAGGVHGRVPEALAWLQIGMDAFLSFMQAEGIIDACHQGEVREEFAAALLSYAGAQARSISHDKPGYVFIRKLMALVESGQLVLLSRDNKAGILPQGCVGYEDGQFYYIFGETALREVKRLCEAQNESFGISYKALTRSLAEDGILLPEPNGSASWVMNLGGKNRRVLRLRKSETEKIMLLC